VYIDKDEEMKRIQDSRHMVTGKPPGPLAHLQSAVVRSTIVSYEEPVPYDCVGNGSAIAPVEGA
jgi:hypothetical protein